MPQLSAIIAAKDEEKDLPGCLESLEGLCDQIVVVVDSASSDKTEEIARRASAVVVLRAFDGYAEQKQAALDAATGDWVLSIDCDELLSPKLREAIRAAITLPNAPSAFNISFEVHFMGRRLRFGGLGRESHVRLFQRARARFKGGLIHEGIHVDGPVRRLTGTMIHTPYADLNEYLEKMKLYTDLNARKAYAAGRRFHFWDHLILPWEIFARLILKAGLLDVRPGVVYGVLSAFHAWLKRVKLAELERESSPIR